MYAKEIHKTGKTIPRLNAKEYENPRDAMYLRALKLNKNFDKVVKFAIEYGIERAYLIQYTGSNVKVTENNMPYLYNCVKTACEILEVEEIPATYVVQDPYMNAMTVGSKHPIIVLHDSLLKRLTHEELMFIIGHEVGHIKSEHCQYHMIGSFLELAITYGTSFIPLVGMQVSQALNTGLDFAYYDWSRKSEFTADHAGLLVCQDLHSAISAQAKLGGYPEEFYDCLDVDGFLQQAQEFDDLEDKAYNKLVKFTLTLDMTHPWEVQRAKELMLWVQSGEYNRILNRCSTWLMKKLRVLEQESENAKIKHEKRKDSAFSAIVDLEDKPETNEVTEDVKGAKALLLKGQNGFKDIQDKIEANAVKRKVEKADNAKLSMLEAFDNEKQLREFINFMSDEEIETQINETIGNLRRINPKK